MAGGYRCEKCGYQEADHALVASRLEGPIGSILTKEEKRKIKEDIKEEFPGICKKYRNRDPRSHLDYSPEEENN